MHSFWTEDTIRWTCEDQLAQKTKKRKKNEFLLFILVSIYFRLQFGYRPLLNLLVCIINSVTRSIVHPLNLKYQSHALHFQLTTPFANLFSLELRPWQCPISSKSQSVLEEDNGHTLPRPAHIERLLYSFPRCPEIIVVFPCKHHSSHKLVVPIPL